VVGTIIKPKLGLQPERAGRENAQLNTARRGMCGGDGLDEDGSPFDWGCYVNKYHCTLRRLNAWLRKVDPAGEPEETADFLWRRFGLDSVRYVKSMGWQGTEQEDGFFEEIELCLPENLLVAWWEPFHRWFDRQRWLAASSWPRCPFFARRDVVAHSAACRRMAAASFDAPA